MFKEPVGVWTIAFYLQKIEIQNLLEMLLGIDNIGSKVFLKPDC